MMFLLSLLKETFILKIMVKLKVFRYADLFFSYKGNVCLWSQLMNYEIFKVYYH